VKDNITIDAGFFFRVVKQDLGRGNQAGEVFVGVGIMDDVRVVTRPHGPVNHKFSLDGIPDGLWRPYPGHAAELRIQGRNIHLSVTPVNQIG